MVNESDESQSNSGSGAGSPRLSLSRRRLLATGSTTAALLLAGCGGSGGDGTTSAAGGNGTTAAGTEPAAATQASTPSGTPAETEANDSTETNTEEDTETTANQSEFADLNLTGPQNATVGQSFNLSLSLRNPGDENRTFTGTVDVAGGGANVTTNETQQVEIGDIAPNETATADVGPFNFSTAANYTISLDEREATHSVAAEPITLDLGETYTFSTGVEATVESARFQSSLFYTSGSSSGSRNSGGANSTNRSNTTDGSTPNPQTNVLRAGSGSVLMIARLSLENTATNEAKFIAPTQQGGSGSGSGDSGGTTPSGRSGAASSMASLRPAEGQWYTSLNDAPLEAAQNIEGGPLNEVTLASGQQRSGWLLARVPREAVTGTFALVHQANGTGIETPPEVMWRIPPNQGSSRALPQITLDSFEMPSPREITNGAKYTLNVTNQGNRSGTFRGVLRVGGNNEDSSGRTVKTFSPSIDPGATATLEGTHPRPYISTTNYQLSPFGESATVETVPATRAYEGTYTSPFDIEYRVSEPVPTDELVFEGETYAAEDGRQWVPLKISVLLPNADVSEPKNDRFTLRANGQTYKPMQSQAVSATLTEPIEGRKYFQVDFKPGQRSTGVLLFETPVGLPVEDMSFEYRYEPNDNPPYAAVWGESGSGARSGSNSTTSTGNTTQS